MADEYTEDSNLRDVLGFDPSESSDRDFSPTPSSSHPERRDWPENWREMFIAQQDSPLTEHVDVDNLFTISKPFSLVKAYGESIQRTYYGFNPDSKEKRKFQNVRSVVMPPKKMEDGYYSFQSGREGEDSEYVRISFNPKDAQNIGNFPIEIIKGGVGDRGIQVDYDENGELLDVRLAIRPDVVHLNAGSTDIYQDNREVSIYRDLENKWKAGGDFGEVEFDELFDENRLIFRRIQNGEVKDDVEVPLKIDQEELKRKWLGEKLLEDPANHDTQLDEGWRVDFFHDAGLRWDAVADDSFHSLTRIPPPAEE